MRDLVIRDVTGYTTSRDYKRLYDLALRQSVVCIVDHSWGDGDVSRDVAHTISDGERVISVSARGIGYVGGYGPTQAEFVRDCGKVNLEFIEPNKDGEP